MKGLESRFDFVSTAKTSTDTYFGNYSVGPYPDIRRKQFVQSNIKIIHIDRFTNHAQKMEYGKPEVLCPN